MTLFTSKDAKYLSMSSAAEPLLVGAHGASAVVSAADTILKLRSEQQAVLAALRQVQVSAVDVSAAISEDVAIFEVVVEEALVVVAAASVEVAAALATPTALLTALLLAHAEVSAADLEVAEEGSVAEAAGVTKIADLVMPTMSHFLHVVVEHTKIATVIETGTTAAVVEAKSAHMKVGTTTHDRGDAIRETALHGKTSLLITIVPRGKYTDLHSSPRATHNYR